VQRLQVQGGAGGEQPRGQQGDDAVGHVRVGHPGGRAGVEEVAGGYLSLIVEIDSASLAASRSASSISTRRFVTG
jgi:hypothetical protein